MTDEEHINAHLDEHPGDTLARLALADWLEEQGRDGEAEGQRWLVAEGRCPRRVHWFADDRQFRWTWYLLSDLEERPYHLPVSGFERCADYFRSRTEAETVAMICARAAGFPALEVPA
jgi:uncharacterized protein (TIGR02996 family)